MRTNNSSRAQLLDTSKLSHDRSLLTTHEVADLIPFSMSFFEKGRIYHYGPNFLRIRGKIFYHVDAVNQWLADHECDPKGGTDV